MKASFSFLKNELDSIRRGLLRGREQIENLLGRTRSYDAARERIENGNGNQQLQVYESAIDRKIEHVSLLYDALAARLATLENLLIKPQEQMEQPKSPPKSGLNINKYFRNAAAFMWTVRH